MSTTVESTTQGTGTTEGTASANTSIENNNNNRNNQGNNCRVDNRRNTFSGNERTWEGDKPDIGAVLGLRTEYLDKKHSFRAFLEKMVEYTLREINHPRDILPLLTDQVDQRDDFINKMPK